jgi:uncharacterized membrane protein (UPF0182 family)
VFAGLAVLNFIVADRLAPTSFGGDTHPVVLRFHELFGRRMRLVRAVASVVLGLAVAVPATTHWKEWLLFRHSVDFGVKDPQFGTDIGFYVFRLPFLTFMFDWLFLAVLLVLLLTVAAHVLNGGILLAPPMPKVRRATKAHFAVLLAVLALLRAGSYWLERYDLTTEDRGYVQGATYSVVKAQLPSVMLLLAVAVFVAGTFVYSIRSGSWRLPLVSCALWVVLALLAGIIYPSVIQALVVNPDQKEKEAKYIARNIEATRSALGIDNVETKSIAFDDLTREAVEQNLAPLQDVRLLDPAVMLSRFAFDQGQLAGLSINDLDVDRYVIDGRLQQTMVAARELDSRNLANTSWQGKHIIATHGCGLVVAPASRVEDNNRPLYENEALGITRPELYFSPAIEDFAIVKTKTSEKACEGSEPEEYSGRGGVQLNSPLRKLAFALSFFDYNLWGSDSVTSQSRIQWIRNVKERAQKIAPFLYFDADPYPVALDGRIVWVIDAFTTTSRYPYAQDGDRSQLEQDSGLDHVFNYVRNSVKVTVDAYDGSVKFYVVDAQDPIIRAWRSAFPKMFLDNEQMPAGLVDHLRYPEDLFRVQTAAYGRYQLDPTKFFERTEAWSVAQAPPVAPRSNQTPSTVTTTTNAATQQIDDDLGSTTKRFVPYYTMFHAPGSGGTGNFSILRPFVPYSKNDQRQELKSFIVASGDPETYGQLTAYVLPESPPVDGPIKVASSAESEESISQELTLLNNGEGGSQVLFGDLQLVPLADGLLYLRPVYVVVNGQAEYRRIIVSYKANSVMEGSIGAALARLFPGFTGDVGDREGGGTGSEQPPVGDDPRALLEQAQNLFQEADDALRANPPDYATYGAKQQEARELIAAALKILQSRVVSGSGSGSGSPTPTTVPATTVAGSRG